MATAWQYRVKPALKIAVLVYESRTFYAAKWTVSEERLTGQWYEDYLLEREITLETKKEEKAVEKEVKAAEKEVEATEKAAEKAAKKSAKG